MQNFPNISQQEAARRQAAGALLIDVRSAGEFAAGHLPGSLSLPLERLPRQIQGLAAPGQTLLLYCTSGERSLSAARVLSRLGYKRLLIVK